jgi:hypothetical protein
MRNFLLFVTASFALGCAKMASPSNPENQGFAASVFADSAVFLYPTPTREVWKWNVLDERGFGAEQFMWEAVWDVSRDPPYSLGQGFEVGVYIEKNSEPRSGSIHDVFRASTGRALVPPPEGLDVAFALQPEDSLFITHDRGLVRISLRRSPTFSRLLMSHPDSVRLEVRLPVINFRDKKFVRVQYRSGR